MNKLLFCEYNMDSTCVELKYADGSMIAIDTNAVDREFSDNMYHCSELDWLIYNKPLEYAQPTGQWIGGLRAPSEKINVRRIKFENFDPPLFLSSGNARD